MNHLGSALARGTAANLASVVALALCSKRETGSALAGINAVSHWAWGDADARRNGLSWKYTLIGALTNQLASGCPSHRPSLSTLPSQEGSHWTAFCFAGTSANGLPALALPRANGSQA